MAADVRSLALSRGVTASADTEGIAGGMPLRVKLLLSKLAAACAACAAAAEEHDGPTADRACAGLLGRDGG